MSCEIHLTAIIQNIPYIRRCLFPTDDSRGSDNWLQTAKISASPTSDLIVLAHERRLVVLHSKWDSHTSLSHFQPGFSESIHDYDRIKSVLCLPLVGESQSSHVGPDWCCIVVGYDSGFVRFYTEQAKLLMEEQFHTENITNIKCQSQHSPRPDISPELHPEELYVQYQSNICVVSGKELFDNLRSCRSQLARGPIISKPPTPPHKKWGFQDQLVNDTAVVGLNLSNTFDHLLTASLCGGFEAKFRTTAPNSTLVVAAGSKPFLGYHYALEGVNQPVLSDVAKAVASKLKSALPTWLTGTKVDKEEVVMQPVDVMGMRFGLSDLRRVGTDVVLSPNGKLAAVSDSLGRVLLVDALRGVIVKVFKGYREAQCAFVQVPDERRSKHRSGNKVALFLVIYSSKKGTLEVFTLQQGTKIATFSASKYSRLVYIPYGLMGFATTSKSRYVCQFTCIFIDSDGHVKEVTVPFHFALAEKNSVKARDIHLYKKLRQVVKTGSAMDMIYDISSELKTPEIKLQTLELLIGCKQLQPATMLRCIELFVEDAELQNVCQNVKKLLQLYLYVTKLNEETVTTQELNLSERDLQGLQKLLDLATSVNNQLKPRVTFCDEVDFAVPQFLNSFIYDNEIKLKDLPEDHLFKAGQVLFKNYVAGQGDFDGLQHHLAQSGIPIKDLFHLAIEFWINRNLDINLNLRQDMSNFFQLIKSLVKLSGVDIVDQDEVSDFWQDIRNNLRQNSRPFPALMAAILLKNAQIVPLDDSIEILTQEHIQWSLLIGKLEDVSTLNIILNSHPQGEVVLPKLSQERREVSLKYILQHGRGAVSELTAQWLTCCGINPQLIIINEIIHTNSLNEDAQEIDEGMHLDMIEQVKTQQIFQYFNLMRQQFPYSLDSSHILSNMAWEYALAWKRDVTNLQNLQAILRCIIEIQEPSIQKGLFQLIWITYLKLILESTTRLINKVGKLPKERLCQQDTGLSDKQILDFLKQCSEFFDYFLEVAQKPASKMQLKFEQIWENGGAQPLVELALQQKEVDYDLVHLHYQLTLVLHMMAKFNVKHAKPVMNLFEASVGALLFTDLQRHVDVNWNKTDIKINASRDQFLRKIITSSLETVTIDDQEQIYCQEHVEWMDKCLLLARIWNLDVDGLRRFQLTQLYVSGYDVIAEELIPAVSDRNLLGEELLKVAGNRLSQFLSSSPNLSQNIAALSPSLSRYMESLNGSWCSPSSLHNITTLGKQIMNCLNEDQKELCKLAEMLLDACITLEEINSD